MDALIIASVFQRCQVKSNYASSHSPWEESPLKRPVNVIDAEYIYANVKI